MVVTNDLTKNSFHGEMIRMYYRQNGGEELETVRRGKFCFAGL